MAHCLHLHRLHRGCSIVDEKPWAGGWVGRRSSGTSNYSSRPSASQAGERPRPYRCHGPPFRRQDDGDGDGGFVKALEVSLVLP